VPIIEDAVELFHYRDLVASLVRRDLTVRYKRSALGFVWTMLNPLLTMLVMAIVFSTAFRFPIEHYPVYLLAGLLLWNFFSQSTLQSADSLVWGGGLLNKIYLPKSIFVVSAILVGLVNLAFALVPLALIMLLTGQLFSPALLFLPVAIFLAALFSLGVGLCISTLAVFFLDILDIFRLVLTVLMYMTPIFYPLSIVPDRYKILIHLNPMFYFVELFRTPVYQGVLPDVTWIFRGAFLALATFVFGWWFFTRMSNEFAYRI
jgi:ABC-2 type transport system permease protein